MADLRLRQPKPRKNKAAKADLEQLFTPPWMVRELVNDLKEQRLGHILDAHQRVGGRKVLAVEPCVGAGAIVNGMSPAFPALAWRTNDLDPQWTADYHLDAGNSDFWGKVGPIQRDSHRLVVTNPPFSEAYRIVPRALEYADLGVIMLLRCTWLEARPDRLWLAGREPDRLIMLPRWSFSGDGKVDSAPAYWMIWSTLVAPGCKIIPKSAQEGFTFDA